MKRSNLGFYSSLMLASLVTVGVGLSEADATPILFNNGTSSGPQNNYANTPPIQELFEDFTLSQNSEITGINWQQHDHDQASYLNTQVLIFAGLPYSGAPVFDSTIAAIRTPNATGTIISNLGNWDGFDYAIAGLSVNLGPGTYWLGLNSNFLGIYSSWDDSIGGPDTINGARLINSFFTPPGLVLGNNLSFTLSGNTNAVPEPSSLGLLSAGLLGLGWASFLGARRRRHQGQLRQA